MSRQSHCSSAAFAVLLCLSLIQFVAAGLAHANLAYDVIWKVRGETGFSAPNVLRDMSSGQPLGIVVNETGKGVVRFDVQGTRTWDYPMNPPVSAAPAVADIDADGAEDVVAADGTGNVVVLKGNGELLWSFQLPGGVLADGCPAVADLDGDGALNIVVGDTSGAVSCLDRNGNLVWRFVGQGARMGPPLIADIYDTPGKEIIITSQAGYVYALSAKGKWMWDLHIPEDLFPNSTPLLADADGDQAPELYIGGGLHHFYRIDLNASRVAFSENVFLHVNSALSAADLNQDGNDEIVFGNKLGGLWSYEGGVPPEFIWTKEIRQGFFYAAPAFANVDGDPELEIVIMSRFGEILILDQEGSILLRENAECSVTGTPLLGDIDGNGVLDVIATQSRGDSVLLLAELGVPHKHDSTLPYSHAASRANNGRPANGKKFEPLPTPTRREEKIAANASAHGKLALLSSTNTWRYYIENPNEKPLAFLFELVHPDGHSTQYVRHLRASSDRVSIDFDVTQQGEYEANVRLVDVASRSSRSLKPIRRKYEGLKSDRIYLEKTLFADTSNALNALKKVNPRAAESCKGRLFELRGVVLALVDEGISVESAGRFASVRTAAERLHTIVTTAAKQSSIGTFLPWEYTPWAYFDAYESLPPRDTQTKELAASLCIGEYESLALNLTNITNGALEVRALLGEMGDEKRRPINDHIELRRAVTVPTFRGKHVSDALPLLDQAGTLSFAPLQTQQLWITVNGNGLTPGTHETVLRLKSVEVEPTEIRIPIRIEAHDLAMPRPRPLRFCMWQYDGGEMGTDQPHVLRELVEHGATVYFGQAPRATNSAKGLLQSPVDFEAHDEAMRRLAPHGIVLFRHPQNAIKGAELFTPGWQRAFTDYLRKWAAHMNGLGFTYENWALYPYDEPSVPFGESAQNLVKVAKVIREADPNIRIFANPMSGATKETAEILAEWVDIWCPQIELLDRARDEFLPLARDHADEIWTYEVLTSAKTISSLGGYRKKFWYTWNLGFVGAGWWSFAQNDSVDPWDGPSEADGFNCTVYNAPEGVVTSKRWEATREGIEDYEYLWLLREAIRNARQRGVPERELEPAVALMETLPIQIEDTLSQAGYRVPLTPDRVPLYAEITKRLQEARNRIVSMCLHVKSLTAAE